jgi:hypothetical protein
MQIPTPNEYAKDHGHNPFPPRWEKWLSAARAAILSAQPTAGRHVSVDEHPGKGTVINVADTSARRPGGGGGPPPTCTVTFLGFQTGCRGTGFGASYAAAWSAAFSAWGSCAGASSGGGLAFGFKAGTSFQAEADDQPARFQLVDSPSGHCTVSGVIRTRDDLAGLVDETPFSFTITGIGNTHDLTFTPIEPIDPTSSTPNSTHSVPEDLAYDCS